MGNQKQKWKPEEEEALKAGIRKHGTGKWKNILNDPEFAPFLTNRSNIDLKDKWRNMSLSNGHGSRDKSRMQSAKSLTAVALPNPDSASIVPLAEDDAMDDQNRSPQETKNAPRYNEMIFEAISYVKDPNGCNIGAIVGFIEQRHTVPQNFRRLLSSKLRRLVLQGKLEKVENCYKIKDPTSGSKTPTPKVKDVRAMPVLKSGLIISSQTLHDAAMTAAYKIAEAENKSFVAAEAGKEAERVSRLAEDTEAMLQLVEEIYEHCSHGEIVLLA